MEKYLETVLLNSVAYNNPHMVTKGLGNVNSKEEMEAFKQMCNDYIDEMKALIDSFDQVLANNSIKNSKEEIKMKNIEVRVGNHGKMYLNPRTNRVIFEIEGLVEIDLETTLLNSVELIKKNKSIKIELHFDGFSISIGGLDIISPVETFNLKDIMNAIKKIQDSIHKDRRCKHVFPHNDTIAVVDSDRGPKCLVCNSILSNRDLDNMKEYLVGEELLYIRILMNDIPKEIQFKALNTLLTPGYMLEPKENKISKILDNKWDGFVQIKKPEQIIIRFPNNYGASIMIGYGIELSLIKYEEDGIWDIMYNDDFPSTVNYIETEEELSSLLETIQKYQGV